LDYTLLDFTTYMVLLNYIHVKMQDIKITFGRSCLLRGAVGVLRATLSLRCGSHHADACPSHA